MDYTESLADNPEPQCGRFKLKPLENGKILRIPDEVLAKLSEYEKNMLLGSIFEDVDASAKQIEEYVRNSMLGRYLASRNRQQDK